MAGSFIQDDGAHLVLYDGVCGLCNRLVQFILTHDRQAAFRFASLQSSAGRTVVQQWGGDPDLRSTVYVLANHRTPQARALTRSDAALFVAGELGWPWKAFRVFCLLPAAQRDRLYNVVARTRYRLFGRSEQCQLPSPELRRRFLDDSGRVR
jgi:predicted DCC family thiol-disulfide oxidoreductase YuxK